jgi:hypothetical protein
MGLGEFGFHREGSWVVGIFLFKVVGLSITG